MPLDIWYHDNDQIDVGCYIRGWDFFPAGSVFRESDPIPRFLSGSIARLGRYSAQELVGLGMEHYDTKTTLRGSLIERSYDPNADATMYPDLISSVRKALENRSVDMGNEHSVAHYQWQGAVDVGRAEPLFQDSDILTDGLRAPWLHKATKVAKFIKSTNRMTILAIPTSGRYHYTVSDGSGGFGTHFASNSKMISEMSNFYSTGWIVPLRDPSFTIESRISNFELIERKGFFSVEYDFDWNETRTTPYRGGPGNIWHYPPFYNRWHVTMTLTYSPRHFGTNSPLVPTEMAILTRPVEKWEYRCVFSSTATQNGNWGGIQYHYPGTVVTYTMPDQWYGSGFTIPISRPRISAGEARWNIHSAESKDFLKVSAMFFQDVEHLMPHIRPSSALSSTDALNTLMSADNRSVLQTLAKLNDLSSQLPEVSEAIRLVKSLPNANFSTLKELIDFLTSLRLQYGFQWRPEYQLLTELLPQVPQILLDVSNLTNQSIVGYGQYDYTFKEPIGGRNAVKLKTRTKIVASQGIPEHLASYLKYDTLGLSPSLSNLWDMVPFSFAVNWLTGLGNRLRDIQGAAALLLISPDVSVHSYLITSPITEEEQERWALTSVGEVNFALKCYIRDASAHVSLPRSGRFDFREPAGISDWTIPLSLLWQLIT